MADLGIARMSKEMGLGGTLTRADLADVVHNRLGLSRAESAQLVERVLHHMCHSLSEGQNVKISGFGSFILKKRAAKIGRNIKKNVAVEIPEHFIPAFKPAKEFVMEVKSKKLPENNPPQ